MHSLWNNFQMNDTEHHEWEVNISSGNGFMPMLAQIYGITKPQ